MNWKEDHKHLEECPSCFTAAHFKMPEWRCHPCPRLLFQNASRDWYQHFKDCDTCQTITSKGSMCTAGEALFDKETDCWIAQNDAGCNSLTCPGKDLGLQDCPGCKEQENAS